MRRSVLSVAVMGGVLALAAAGPGFSQINTSGFAPIQRATFNLAEAYPAVTGGYTGNSPVTISPNGCWTTTQQVVSGALSPTQAGQTQSQFGVVLGTTTPVTAGATGGTQVQVVVVTPTLAERCNTTLQPTLFNAIPSFGQTLFAVAGVLCLPTAGNPMNPRLNVNAFAMLGAGDDPSQPCFVQMVRLIKEIPGSIKCPDVYGTPVLDANGLPTGKPAKMYAQFGATPTGIRTWWSLNYTMPGTKFSLEVTVVCRKTIAGIHAPSIHVDRYSWVVVANADTLPVVINLEHTNTIGTAEIPCIVNEQAYCDLMAASGLIKEADISGSLQDRFTAVQTFEGLIEQYCTFVDFVDPTILFPGPVDTTSLTPTPTYQPPSDLGTILGGSGSVGIIDSLEHPCCCKLLVDIEAIAQVWGVAV